MAITIYHNPRCSKSRQTLALLEENGMTPEIVLYLQDAPSKAVLSDIAKKLGLSSVREMMRVKESVYGELGLKDETSDDALLKAMAENPVLIERPIVVNGDRAAIGRPPESVLEIL